MDRMSRAFDLLDGSWYASQPYDDWAWMREHAPAYSRHRAPRTPGSGQW